MLDKLKQEVELFSKEADKGYNEWQKAEAQQVAKEEEYKKVLLKIKEKPTMELLKKKVELSHELERITELVSLTKNAYYDFVEVYEEGHFMNQLSVAARKSEIPKEELKAEKEAFKKLNEFLKAYETLKTLEKDRIKAYLNIIKPYETHQNKIKQPSSFGASISKSLLISGLNKTKISKALMIDVGELSTIERERSIYPVLKDIAKEV